MFFLSIPIFLIVDKIQNTAESLQHQHFDAHAKDIWKECLSIIKDNVPFITYNTWFLPIKPFELENSTLKIYVPNTFFIEWIEEHYNTLINKTILQVLGPKGKLLYVIYEEKEPEQEQQVLVNGNSPALVQLKPREFETFLNPRYIFENFISYCMYQMSFTKPNPAINKQWIKRSLTCIFSNSKSSSPG